MEALGYILETQEIELPGGDATSDQQDAYGQWFVDDTKVRCYMLASMSNELQKQHESMKSSRFIVNFHMNKLSCLLSELLNMLVTAQNAMNNKRKDKKVVLVVGTSSSKTGKKNKKSKKGYVPQQLAGVSKNKGKAKVAVDKGTCFHCGKDGHWKRNCQWYLASLKANKGKKPLEEPRRSGRVTHTPARYLNLHENVQELFVHGDNDHRDDPTTYEEAISDIDSSKWLEAMKSEMDSMSKNQVWDLVDPPEGIVPIGNK
ncbi:hypothetical protein CRG98_029129 [Punica granatum]|uniref:CCHC-type domain-containing protein n=1 Tax=Punica granatum TaxID=22663 RepID=A0A2I0J2L9_PUNGR|nr:hypothetical protein CRG98_029129 [Punica granatum]